MLEMRMRERSSSLIGGPHVYSPFIEARKDCEIIRRKNVGYSMDEFHSADTMSPKFRPTEDELNIKRACFTSLKESYASDTWLHSTVNSSFYRSFNTADDNFRRRSVYRTVNEDPQNSSIRESHKSFVSFQEVMQGTPNYYQPFNSLSSTETERTTVVVNSNSSHSVECFESQRRKNERCLAERHVGLDPSSSSTTNKSSTVEKSTAKREGSPSFHPPKKKWIHCYLAVGKSCEEGGVCQPNKNDAASESSVSVRQVRSASPHAAETSPREPRGFQTTKTFQPNLCQVVHPSSVDESVKGVPYSSSYSVPAVQLRTPVVASSIPVRPLNSYSVFPSIVNNFVSNSTGVPIAQKQIVSPVDVGRHLYVPVPVASTLSVPYTINPATSSCALVKRENNVNHVNSIGHVDTVNNDGNCFVAVGSSHASAQKPLPTESKNAGLGVTPSLNSASLTLVPHDAQTQQGTRPATSGGSLKNTLRLDLGDTRAVMLESRVVQQERIVRSDNNHSTEGIAGSVLRCLPNYELHHHGYLQNGLNPAHSSKDENSKKKAGNAPSREVHNKLEKNRRAHLKECFDLLRRQIPNLDDKKVSNQNILKAAHKCINTLKRKEREYEHEMERLAREKISSQQHLAALKKELVARWDHIDFNAILPDMAALEQQRDKETNSTTTASEQPDTEDQHSLQNRNDQFRISNNSRRVSNCIASGNDTVLQFRQNAAKKIRLSPSIVSVPMTPPIFENQRSVCASEKSQNLINNLPPSKCTYPISSNLSHDVPSSVVTYTPQASPQAGVVGHCVTHQIVSHPSVVTYTPQPSPQSPLVSDVSPHVLPTSNCNSTSVAIVNNNFIVNGVEKTPKMEPVEDSNQPLNLSTNMAVLKYPVQSDSFAIYSSNSKFDSHTETQSLRCPTSSPSLFLQQSGSNSEFQHEKMKLQVVNDVKSPHDNHIIRSTVPQSSSRSYLNITSVSSNGLMPMELGIRSVLSTDPVLIKTHSSHDQGVTTNGSFVNMPTYALTNTKDLAPVHTLAEFSKEPSLVTTSNLKFNTSSSFPQRSSNQLVIRDTRDQNVKNSTLRIMPDPSHLSCGDRATRENKMDDATVHASSTPTTKNSQMPLRVATAVAGSFPPEFGYKLIAGDQSLTNGINGTKPIAATLACDLAQSGDRPQSSGDGRLLMAVSRNGLPSMHVTLPPTSRPLHLGDAGGSGAPLNLSTSTAHPLEVNAVSSATFSLSKSSIVSSYIPLASTNVVPQLLPNMMVTPVVVSPTLVNGTSKTGSVSSCAENLRCNVSVTVEQQQQLGSNNTTLVLSRQPQHLGKGGTRTLMLPSQYSGQQLTNTALVVVPSVSTLTKGYSPSCEMIAPQVGASHTAMYTNVGN
ncbi:Myc-type basic helix-loop-helix (bHLH) domain [Trinorchestia longiramus]|nr:Myc-type basic helix-loop-helix (bHLH) domain [Trinorchestia longiramus]